MRAAFVHLFNDLAGDKRVKQRKKFILERAEIVLSNLKESTTNMNKKTKVIAKKYVRRLSFLLKNNRIHYNDDAVRYDIVGYPNGARVFGYARVKGKWRITLTEDIWNVYGYDEALLIEKIDYDILHEIKHTLIQNPNHPGNYDAEINLIGYFNPRNKYE